MLGGTNYKHPNMQHPITPTFQHAKSPSKAKDQKRASKKKKKKDPSIKTILLLPNTSSIPPFTFPRSPPPSPAALPLLLLVSNWIPKNLHNNTILILILISPPARRTCAAIGAETAHGITRAARGPIEDRIGPAWLRHGLILRGLESLRGALIAVLGGPLIV